MAQQFNTTLFSWAEVDIQVGSRLITGCRGLSYDSSQEKEFVYAKGDLPQAIQRGNRSFKGELMVLQSELEVLIANAPNKNLLDYRNLEIVVSYKSEGGALVSDALIGVEFTDVSKALRQNDKFMEVTLPIMFLNVKYGI